MDRRLGLLLGRLEFLRTAEKVRVADRLDRAEDWARVTVADLETWLGRTVRARWDWGELRRRWEGDRRFLDRPGTGWVMRGEAGFPAALAEIADPPWALWVRGEPLALDRPWVGVVGTRVPDEGAKRAAWDLGGDLARVGVVVVSGLARGIDGQAHRGAVETGLTVAVLGNGIDTVCPGGHQGLARRILATGGALVSEYGPGEPAFGYRFVERNRIISGLARSVVVVQAPVRSGALITADFALDQGRDVAVHAAGLEGERGAGTRALAAQGAPVVTGAAGVMQLWNDPVIGKRDGEWDFAEGR
ncbi:MAG TPA: DNA-processing protein DprA [Spirochaetia bacterium]|jgi:DNA processing protein|nr:DNA-processing protein DprA [Spirochaetia bacterium]